jgi:hypothetical protein
MADMMVEAFQWGRDCRCSFFGDALFALVCTVLQSVRGLHRMPWVHTLYFCGPKYRQRFFCAVAANRLGSWCLWCISHIAVRMRERV